MPYTEYTTGMRVFGLNLPKSGVATPPVLSHEAKHRLKVLDWYQAHERNARLTCRHFSLSPDTFYRWRRRYDPRRLSSLEPRSRRPQHVRPPTWSPALAQAVQRLRAENPR